MRVELLQAVAQRVDARRAEPRRSAGRASAAATARCRAAAQSSAGGADAAEFGRRRRPVEAPDARKEAHRSGPPPTPIGPPTSPADRPYRRSARAAGRPVARSTAPPTAGSRCSVRLRPSFSSTKGQRLAVLAAIAERALVEVGRRARRGQNREARGRDRLHFQRQRRAAARAARLRASASSGTPGHGEPLALSVPRSGRTSALSQFAYHQPRSSRARPAAARHAGREKGPPQKGFSTGGRRRREARAGDAADSSRSGERAAHRRFSDILTSGAAALALQQFRRGAADCSAPNLHLRPPARHVE